MEKQGLVPRSLRDCCVRAPLPRLAAALLRAPHIWHSEDFAFLVTFPAVLSAGSSFGSCSLSAVLKGRKSSLFCLALPISGSNEAQLEITSYLDTSLVVLDLPLSIPSCAPDFSHRAFPLYNERGSPVTPCLCPHPAPPHTHMSPVAGVSHPHPLLCLAVSLSFSVCPSPSSRRAYLRFRDTPLCLVLKPHSWLFSLRLAEYRIPAPSPCSYL